MRARSGAIQVKHPRHVNGGLLVHLSGIMGIVHSYYVLGLRHADGWIGYGARARDMRFKSIALVGEPIELDCKATHVRKGSKRVVVRYDFRFTQSDRVVYESDQTAMFIRIEDGDQPAIQLTADCYLTSAVHFPPPVSLA